MVKVYILLLLFAFIFSCNTTSPTDTAIAYNDNLNVSLDSIVNKKDPICDMDIPEHLSDTAMIGGKIWGYCSVVCKEKHALGQ